MSKNKLFTIIGDIFDEKKKVQRKRAKELKALLEKLKKYLEKLEKDLSAETDKKKIRQLENEVKVVKKKCKKAHNLLKSI